MKKRLFTVSVAALLLATGTAHADDRKLESSFRRCQVWKNFTHKAGDARPGLALGDQDEVWLDDGKEDATVTLNLEDILELQKHLPLLRKCKTFWKCTEDRDAGKVKHCYKDDRRWR
jgi:hypothetical protein